MSTPLTRPIPEPPAMPLVGSLLGLDPAQGIAREASMDVTALSSDVSAGQLVGSGSERRAGRWSAWFTPWGRCGATGAYPASANRSTPGVHDVACSQSPCL
jgi:hypothetical protein